LAVKPNISTPATMAMMPSVRQTVRSSPSRTMPKTVAVAGSERFKVVAAAADVPAIPATFNV